LRAYAETCEQNDTRAALSILVEAPDELSQLPAAVEVAAYHIGREGLTNVVRHAQAKQCELKLGVEGAEKGQLRLSIRDDGQGIDDDVRAGVGLTAMRERAAELGGTFTITSQPGAGTQITAVLPLAGTGTTESDI